jgi:hypothetical protein
MEITVRKADYCPQLRDQNGLIYPDGVFKVKKTIYVTRRINAGDLIWIKE